MPTTELQAPTAHARHQSRALLLVFCCTLLGAAAQVFIKQGTTSLGPHPSMLETAIGIFSKPLLFSGYALLGASTVLFVLALRKGELSLLYPVFTLTYVWVTVLSVLIFHDSVNAFKIAGIVVIMAGVGILGRASRQ